MSMARSNQAPEGAHPPVWDVFRASCPTRLVLSRIADKWAALIVSQLLEGPRRPASLRRTIEGVSQKMLTQTLRALERDGLVVRKTINLMPAHVEYALTPLGESLGQVVDQLRIWSETHVEIIEESRRLFDAREPR